MNAIAAINALHTLVWAIGLVLICLLIFCAKYKGNGGSLALIIQAINAVHTNVWCVIIVGLGVVLIMTGHNAEGTQLTFGAFGVLKGSDNQRPELASPNERYIQNVPASPKV